MEHLLSTCLQKSTEAHPWVKTLSMGYPGPCWGQMDKVWKHYYGWGTQRSGTVEKTQNTSTGWQSLTERSCRLYHQWHSHLQQTRLYPDLSEMIQQHSQLGLRRWAMVPVKQCNSITRPELPCSSVYFCLLTVTLASFFSSLRWGRKNWAAPTSTKVLEMDVSLMAQITSQPSTSYLNAHRLMHVIWISIMDHSNYRHTNHNTANMYEWTKPSDTL